MTGPIGFDSGIPKSSSTEGFSYIPKSSKKKSDAAKQVLDITIKNLGFRAQSAQQGKIFLGGACAAIGLGATAIGAIIGGIGTLVGGAISTNPLNGGPLIGVPVIVVSAVVGGACIGAGVAATGYGLNVIRNAGLPKAIARKLFKGAELRQVKKELGVTKEMTSMKSLSPEIKDVLNAKRQENKQKAIVQFLDEQPLVKQFLEGKKAPKKRDEIQKVEQFGDRNVFRTFMEGQANAMFERTPPPTINEAVTELTVWLNRYYS